MMATYFNGGSEIQSDNLQTLYLMNRGYASYSDASQQPPGVLLLNHGGATALHQGSPHLVGIPLAGIPSPGDEISAAGTSHGQLVPRYHYNLWGGAADGNNQSQIPTAIAIGNELGSPMGFRRPAPVSLAATSSTSTLDHHHHHHHQQQQQGGLSLSLNNSSPHKNVAMTMTVLSPGSGTPTTSAVTNGVAGYGNPSVIMGSKFLKAAQQLLDEVVNVGKAIDSKTDGSKDKAKAAAVVGSSSGGGGGGGDQLTTAQRQELQMKKAKLLNMLDEVEQRYRQYHGQMQMVAASFEQAAGAGSARSYTALALQTISKQFRCLKDAIATQIKATGRSMGEEEEEEDGKGRSRLRMVDNQLRQQRALQQLGMMHHNAWRPQRGLPERAVSVLRAWLFEHFLHPYPKDSDKHILAKQTGLTRSQVSNWFINARVRLWKPMVEEMYVEEMKSHEQNNSDNTTTPTSDHNQDSTIASKSTGPHHSTHHDVHHELVNKPSHHNFNQNPQHGLLPPPSSNDVVSNSRTTLLSPSSSNGPTLHSVGPLQGFSIVGSEMDPMSPKRQRMMIPSDVIHNNSNNNNTSSPMDKEIKAGGRDLFPPDLGGFGSYPISEIGSRFNPDHHHHHLGQHQQQQQQHQHQYHHGNAVSLTLGLPHDSDQSTSLAGNNHHHHHHQQQNFLHGHQAMQLGRRALEIGIGEAEICGIATSQPPPHSANAGGGYEEMNDVQNRKRFAAQLLPDFVT